MGVAPVAGLAMGGSALSAFEQGQAGKAQANYYNYLGAQANTNATLAQARAKADIRNIGMDEFQQTQGVTRRLTQTIGAQKAGLVSGAGASSRTAQDLIKDSMEGANLDELAIRYNADQRSRMAQIGADTQSMNYRAQAGGFGMAAINARNAAGMGQFSTLLGGAGQVANSYYMGQMYANMYGNRPLSPS